MVSLIVKSVKTTVSAIFKTSTFTAIVFTADIWIRLQYNTVTVPVIAIIENVYVK